MIINESGWFASFEKSVSVVIFLCLWHYQPKFYDTKIYQARVAVPTIPPKTMFLYPILQRTLSTN